MDDQSNIEGLTTAVDFDIIQNISGRSMGAKTFLAIFEI
jgi:hypothetical protein